MVKSATSTPQTKLRCQRTDLLLPMANSHVGLAHSILSLAGAHFVLSSHDSRFRDRLNHHSTQAIELLSADLMNLNHTDETISVGEPVVAQLIIMCLWSRYLDDHGLCYEFHLDALKSLVGGSSCFDAAFMGFFVEFTLYHDVLHSITSPPYTSILSRPCSALPHTIDREKKSVYVGIYDGLFMHLVKLVCLREKGAKKMNDDATVISEKEVQAEIRSIAQDLSTWQIQLRGGPPRSRLLSFWRQCVTLLLHTVSPHAVVDTEIDIVIHDCVQYLHELPQNASELSVLLMPLYILGISVYDRPYRAEISQAFMRIFKHNGMSHVMKARATVLQKWAAEDRLNGMFVEDVQSDKTTISNVHAPSWRSPCEPLHYLELDFDLA